MITYKGNYFDLQTNSLNWFFYDMYGDQSGEIVGRPLGFQGLIIIIHSFYFAINQKYNNSKQKYIKDNIQYPNN